MEKKKVKQLAESVRNTEIIQDEKVIITTVSIGVADKSDCKVMTFKELFNSADMALYKA